MTTDALIDRIQSLDDASALHALMVVAERHEIVLDVQSSRLIEERFAEALTQAHVDEQLDFGPEPPSRGALARLALAHFAGQGAGQASEVERALTVTPTGHRLEPVTLGVLGAVVLYAFSSEITLEKKPNAGWSFRFHHRPLKESTTGKLLSELFKLWRPS